MVSIFAWHLGIIDQSQHRLDDPQTNWSPNWQVTLLLGQATRYACASCKRWGPCATGEPRSPHRFDRNSAQLPAERLWTRGIATDNLWVGADTDASTRIQNEGTPVFAVDLRIAHG
jgi:hypothetical protein